MKTYDDAWHLQESLGPTVVTIGNFDGIHRGQQEVIGRVLERAAATGAGSAVVTFEPHPLSVLRPERPLQRLTTPEQKQTLLARLGVEHLAVVRFTPEFSRTSARSFVEDFIYGKLGVRELYVGSSFSFGREREGDLRLLRSLGERLGFRAVGLEEVRSSEQIVSSTLIRQAIRQGEVTRAANMLGRSWAITGRVEHGHGRGRLHGWPTVNVAADHDLLPADGVYASQVWIPGEGRVLPSVTNVGRRPTFPNDDLRVVEAHLFDFDRDLYGKRVELGFVERLRGERRFPSVTELVEQIATDADTAREFLSRPGCSSLVPTLGV